MTPYERATKEVCERHEAMHDMYETGLQNTRDYLEAYRELRGWLAIQTLEIAREMHFLNAPFLRAQFTE